MIQDKNPNTMIIVVSLHRAFKKSNENELEYINQAITALTKGTATANKSTNSVFRITTNSEPHDPEEP